VLWLVISALTVGICRSVCITVVGTYRGALTVDLRILFWNLCRISVFDLFAVPQRGMPYVQIGSGHRTGSLSGNFVNWQPMLSTKCEEVTWIHGAVRCLAILRDSVNMTQRNRLILRVSMPTVHSELLSDI